MPGIRLVVVSAAGSSAWVAALVGLGAVFGTAAAAPEEKQEVATNLIPSKQQ